MFHFLLVTIICATKRRWKAPLWERKVVLNHAIIVTTQIDTFQCQHGTNLRCSVLGLGHLRVSTFFRSHIPSLIFEHPPFLRKQLGCVSKIYLCDVEKASFVLVAGTLRFD